MMKLCKLIFIYFSLLVLYLSQQTVWAQYSLKSSVFGIGCSETNNNTFNLMSIAGQPLIGKAVNSSFINHSGFWYTTSFLTGLEEFMEPVPKSFELYQNYPNPFNPVTHIKFAIPKLSKVKLEVFNILGQRVAILVDKKMEPGFQLIEFNAGNLASGYYFYHIQADGFQSTKKMILIK